MHRPDAWRYRDYVVESFNDDKPYTDFVKEQLAGDEIDAEEPDHAGGQRLQPPRSAAQERGQSGRRQFAQRSAHRDDQHRRRGVPRRDGRLRALPRSQVRSLPPIGLLPPAGALRADAAERRRAGQPGRTGAWKVKAAPLEQEKRRLQMQLRRAPDGEKAKLELQLEELDDKMPAPLASIYSVTDEPKKASPIQILFHGDYLSPVAKVGVRPLGILLPEGDAGSADRDGDSRGSNWRSGSSIRQNPLTARVMVNRIWQYHFGRGMVSTPNDFGRMGTRPSNPELLDWLANRFVEGGWQHEAAASHDPAVERLPAVQHLAHRKGGDGEGFRERAALEVQPSPPGGGGDSRRHAGRCRPPEPEGRRTERHVADRSGSGAQSEASAVLGGHARQDPNTTAARCT